MEGGYGLYMEYVCAAHLMTVLVVTDCGTSDRCAQRERVKLSRLDLTITRKLSRCLIHGDEHIHYRNAQVCHVFTVHGKAKKTLGKSFAECYTRQTALGVHSDGKSLFAECFLSGTR